MLLYTMLDGARHFARSESNSLRLLLELPAVYCVRCGRETHNLPSPHNLSYVSQHSTDVTRDAFANLAIAVPL